MSIPLYSAAGKRLNVISKQELERLEAGGRLARVVRRRDGSPARAYLMPRDGFESACPVSVYMGQRYSFPERLPSCRVWTLRRLGRGNELRPIFLAVLKSCLRAADESNENHGRKPNRYHPATGFLLNESGIVDAARAPEGAVPKVPFLSAGPCSGRARAGGLLAQARQRQGLKIGEKFRQSS